MRCGAGTRRLCEIKEFGPQGTRPADPHAIGVMVYVERIPGV